MKRLLLAAVVVLPFSCLIAQVPQLPLTWVNNNEGNTAFAYELSLPGTWITGPAPGCTFHAPYWSGSPTSIGLQSAINDIETCRKNTGVGIALDIPPGLYSSASGIIIPQSSTTLASNFLVLRSTQDSNLPNGTIICSKGPQDNLPQSTDPGIDNPSCNGVGMYFQKGPTIVTIAPGAFTLANGVKTNTSAYNDVQYMWTVEETGTNKSALQTCSPVGVSGGTPPPCAATTIAPDHWLIEDMEARMSVGNTGDSTIVALTEAGTETSTTQLPTHIHFRKSWIHGDWTSLSAGANSVSTGILIGCFYCSIVDSQISQILRPGAEGHASGARWGSQLKIDHNWFEGGSSGFFCGGFTAPPSISGLVPCNDVEFRRNRLTFPSAWLGVDDSSCGTHGVGTVPSSNPHWGCTSSSGYSLVRKNVEEIKEGERILYSGNIEENSDDSGGQSGVLGDFNIRNSSGTTYAGSNNYQTTINDITDESNIRRNGCEGFELDSSNSKLGDGGGVSFILNRAAFTNDLIYNVTNLNPGCAGVNSVGIYLSSALQQWKGNITENSTGTMATFVGTCSIDAGNCPNSPTTGFEVTDVNPGDPISIGGCTSITAFNVPTHTVAGYTQPSAVGPLAASGTNPASLTVVYPWVGTPNALDNSGNCVLTKGEGGPANLSITHMTFVTDSTHAITANNAPSTGPNFAISNLLRDSIVLGGGWFNNPVGEGTATEEFDDDVTSLSANHLVWPTRTAASYSEYGNNSSYPDSAGCTGAGCHPPTTMYFPATAYCTGSTFDPTCVGFMGAMSIGSVNTTTTSAITVTGSQSVLTASSANIFIGQRVTVDTGSNQEVVVVTAIAKNNSGVADGFYAIFTKTHASGVAVTASEAMPLTLQNYHSFELRSDSIYLGGHADDASDGTSMGANIPAIDSAQTQNPYVCKTTCGSPGPFSD